MVGWIVDLLKELIFKPFFGESFQLIKYYSLKKTGERLLAARDLYARKKGVDILLSIGFSYPEFRQEIFDSLGRAFRHEFNKKKDFDPQKIRFQNAYVQFSLLKTYLNALTAVKRHGENGYSYLIDISQVAFYSQHSVKPDHYSGNERLPLADLRCANFRDFYMPGCFFMNIFNGSSFENADLGGCVFYNCSLEFCNFKNAKICASLFNESIVGNHQENHLCFIQSRLFGANLDEASLTACKIVFHPEEQEQILNRLRAKLPGLTIQDLDTSGYRLLLQNRQ